MKLIIAIVNSDDSSAVSANLTREGFTVTKLATTGGFLKAGNTTFIIGTEPEKVEKALGIIKDFSSKRTQVVPSGSGFEVGMYASFPVEVAVGGATVFVMDIEQFKKF